MKVGFCGTQCSGKSTQAELLTSHHDGWTLMKSASRQAAESGVGVNRQGTLSTQIIIAGIMEAQMHQANMMLKNGSVRDLVWERTHIDAIAYGRTSDLWGRDAEYMGVVWKLAEKQLCEYFDMVFYFPAYPLSCYEGELNNGIRDLDPDYRNQIDESIFEILTTLNVNYIPVPQGSIEVVHDFIYQAIALKEASKRCLEHDKILTRLAHS